MKRLVFCFDGTWNRLDAPAPTNVVLTAQSVSPISKDGVVQIIHYDQGVGTSRYTHITGGLFGDGLLDNIVDAYTFLIFNYEVGDEIYVFGFSRGAYTARSFVGLLRNVGILRRADAGKITEAVERYKGRSPSGDHNSNDLLEYRLKASQDVCVDQEEDTWRCQNAPGYKSGGSPIFRIRYLGVWDTVGALGVPSDLFIAPFINKAYQFYDTGLSDLVVSARHAVAIDELRKSFRPTLWTNVDELNAALGFGTDEEAAPYQQKWFPGTHGSVGGGGPERGLSDFALDWVVDGARKAGLQLDTSEGSRAFSLSPNAQAPLVNIGKVKKGVSDFFMSLLPTAPRQPGPTRLYELSNSAIRRWSEPASNLPEHREYRPVTLSGVAGELDNYVAGMALPTPPKLDTPPVPAPTAGSYYRVVRGDTLTGIAHTAYGAASKFAVILAANSNLLDGPDHIYIGQILYIPKER